MNAHTDTPLPPSSSVSTGRSLLRFIHDRNPFYLLSALSMFIGFRIVLAAIDSAPGDLKHLLLLIVTLNVYEALLIALALFLIVKRGLQRDGWILLSVEALFLVDLTNLNAEFFTASQRYGSIVNGICFVLAMFKVLIIVRTLGLKLSPGTMIYIAAQMAFLLGMPGMFKLMTVQARVSPTQIYGVWWMMALLIVTGALVVRRPLRGADSPMAWLPWRLYVLVPLVSLIVHLAGENRVYWVHFQPANVAPVLLALIVPLNLAHCTRRLPTVVALSLTMILMAVFLSAVPTEDHWLLIRHRGNVGISPLRIVLFASAAISLWLYLIHRSWLCLQTSAVSATLGFLGSSIPQMTDNSTRLVKWFMHQAYRAVPQTALQWGYLAIGVSFALLGLGAIVSLKKTRSLSPEPPSLLK